MPETTLTVKWSKDEVESIYSPSSIIRQYFKQGETMSAADFETKSKEAFSHASRRVEEVYGYACSSAQASLARIIHKVSSFEDKDASIEIVDVS